MATIVERKRKNGTSTFLAQIIRRAHGLKESKTFPSRKAAEAWAKKREKEIASDLTEGRSPLTQKAQCLQTIRKEYSIADRRCDQITSADIAAFAQELHARLGLKSASTVGNYLSHLAAVFRIARTAWNMPLDRRAMEGAQEACKALGTVAKSKDRTRRPTLDELDRIMQHFADKIAFRPKSCPMHRVTFYNARRPHSSLDGKTPDQAYFNPPMPDAVAAQPRRQST